MKKMIIEGGKKLTGTIEISGSKNSAVALVPASILSKGIVKIDNIPNISDIDALTEILEYLGAKVTREDKLMIIDSRSIENKEIPESISKKLRASYYFMGALLGKYKKVEMYFPGGCSIGERPINLHLKGFEALGATVTNEGNRYKVEAEKLVGNKIYLDIASVGATINIMLAATYAEGITTIENAAREPHIVNVATFLNQMGASIRGAGTSTIKIKGVESLEGAYTEVVPDYIEAGTYVLAGALMGENLTIKNLIPSHIESLTSKLKDMGSEFTIKSNSITITAKETYRPVNITTAVFPGFPTDLQQPFSILLTKCNGKSKIKETIWENRFMHIPYLEKLGAKTEINVNEVKIIGPTNLVGTEVTATDLRAGAAMILAGLTATGTTTVESIEHVLRGYENIVEKLVNVGAKVRIEEI